MEEKNEGATIYDSSPNFLPDESACGEQVKVFRFPENPESTFDLSDTVRTDLLPQLLVDRLKGSLRWGRLGETLSHYGAYVSSFERAGLLTTPVASRLQGLVEKASSPQNALQEQALKEAIKILDDLKFK